MCVWACWDAVPSLLPTILTSRQSKGHSPIRMDNCPRLGVNNVDNDTPVAPAPFKVISTFFHATRMKSLVQESPGQLFLSMDLKSATFADSKVLLSKVRVWLAAVIRSKAGREERDQVWVCVWVKEPLSLCCCDPRREVSWFAFLSGTPRIRSRPRCTENKFFSKIVAATKDQRQSGTQLVHAIFILYRPEEAWSPDWVLHLCFWILEASKTLIRS